MHPHDEADAAILIAAFNKRKRIEYLKTKALVVAAINPEEASKAFLEYTRELMPEYDIMRAGIDAELAESYEVEKTKAFSIELGNGGAMASEIVIKDG